MSGVIITKGNHYTPLTPGELEELEREIREPYNPELDKPCTLGEVAEIQSRIAGYPPGSKRIGDRWGPLEFFKKY